MITHAARAVEVLVGAGLKQGLLVSSGRHLFTAMDPVVWLTGFKPMSGACAVLDDDGAVVLYLESKWDGLRARRLLPELKTDVVPDPFAAAAASLAGSAELGTAGTEKLTLAEFAALGSGSPLRAIDDELDAVARTKDAAEVAAFRRATEIGELAYDHLLDNLEVGMTDVDAEALLEAKSRELGSQDTFIFLSAAVRNRAVQRPWGRILLPGDIILMEVSPSVDGIFSQICRTVSVGKPSRALRQSHELLRAALRDGIEACAPGVTVSDVVGAIDQRLIDEGYGEYCKPPFMRVRGHGMGFGSVAPGDFLSRNPTALRAGDTFVLHPNQMLPTVGYLMCGEPMTITDTGGSIVSRGVAELGVIATLDDNPGRDQQ